MKLLVTGGAGFIGSNFVHYWLKKYPQDTVVNLDKLTYAGNKNSLLDLSNNPNHVFIEGDICDEQVVHTAMEGADIVVHFAAETHVDRSIKDPFVFLKTNVLGTAQLLEAALKHKVKRFHHISTDEVFGTLAYGTDNKFTDTTCYDPRSPYSASKASSDHLVRAYYHTFGLPITISNCSNNFGPFMFPEKFIPLAVTNLLEGEKIPIYGDGNQIRDWLYVEDHCEAIDLILGKGKIGQTYLIGGLTEDIANIEIAKKILRIMNRDETHLVFVKDRPGHDIRYSVDWTKIQRELGWNPSHSFEEALKKTVQWYIDHESWWKPLRKKLIKFF